MPSEISQTQGTIAEATSFRKQAKEAKKAGTWTDFDELLAEKQQAQSSKEDYPMKEVFKNYDFNSGAEGEKKKAGEVGVEGSLKLFIAQMQNQGMEGTSTEAMATMASTIALVEQSANTSKAVQNVDRKFGLMQATAMLGKSATVSGRGLGNHNTPVESSVKMILPSSKGDPVLELENGQRVRLDQILILQNEGDNTQQIAANEIEKHFRSLVAGEDEHKYYLSGGKQMPKREQASMIDRLSKRVTSIGKDENLNTIFKMDDGKLLGLKDLQEMF